MNVRMSLAVAIGCFALAPIALGQKDKEKDGKDAIKAFEGDWRITAWEQGGGELPKEFLDVAKWVVKGNKYTFTAGDQMEEGTLKADPDKKPAALDIEITAGMDKGKTQVGIYKVEKETITICLARPGEKDRPTEFTAAGDKGFILITMKKRDD